MFNKILPFLSLATPLLAISITSPAPLSSYDIGSSIPITWTSVNTDPSTITIQLVNFASYPTVTETIASDVKTSDDKYTIKAGSISKTGTGFQINFIGTTSSNSGILAQSGDFNLTSSSSSTTSSSTTTTSSSISTSSKSSTSSPSSLSTTLATLSSTLSGSPYTNATSTTTTSGSTGTGSAGVSTTGTSSASASASQFTGAADNVKIGAGMVMAGVAGAFAFLA
ncbi:putative extracellular conserved serine-rich protein [Phaeomoniella chlamydospora]|uniref:Putative extracellular conserved serine-rich protein n=1 Tax=Phaeomoniella chlamydospora TaxID=158046 RepID=A0A0G2GPE3_PHACM|nr:putative extracellular conserved serine-rich protein [Phaeomoniella chlamydospora]